MRFIVSSIVVALAGIAPTHAQYWQGHGTWCTGPRGEGGAMDCSYYSEAQCRATRRGCVPNPAPYWESRGFQIPPDARPRPQPR